MCKSDLLARIGEILKSEDAIFDLAASGIDQCELEALAAQDNLDAAILLYVGMTCGVESWEETAKDPETGEDITYIQSCPIFDEPDKFIFNPEGTDILALEEKIAAAIKDADTDKLRSYACLSGVPGSVAYLVDSVLAERGDADALYAMAGRYHFGDEQYGIFVSREKARSLYNASAEAGYEFAKEALEYIDDDVADDDDSHEYVVKVTADSSVISRIDDLITGLTEQCGVVTFDVLFKAMVGSDEYMGVVDSCANAGDTLILEVETPNVEPLLYAIEYVFEGAVAEAAILDGEMD